MCNKTKYASWNIAQEELNKIKKVNKDFNNKVIYQCKKCLGWHIGRDQRFFTSN